MQCKILERSLWFSVAIVAAVALGGCKKESDDAPAVPSSPEITLVSPDMGGLAGGEFVRITTANFRDDFTADVPLVFFGPDPAPSVTPISANEVEAETPAVPAPVVVDVQVVGTGFVQVATLPDGFVYDNIALAFGQAIPLPSLRVIYVLQRSGGMIYEGGTWVDRFGNTVTGTLWERSVDGVLASLDRLPDTVRFNIYSFACNRDSFALGTVPATAANKAAAEAWVLGHFPWGGSGIGLGVAAALEEKENLTLLLPSNGRPDCGAQGLTGHLNMILNANTQGAHIHTFGLGDFGEFEQFLTDIAVQTGGTYTHIYP